MCRTYSAERAQTRMLLGVTVAPQLLQLLELEPQQVVLAPGTSNWLCIAVGTNTSCFAEV